MAQLVSESDLPGLQLKCWKLPVLDRQLDSIGCRAAEEVLGFACSRAGASRLHLKAMNDYQTVVQRLTRVWLAPIKNSLIDGAFVGAATADWRGAGYPKALPNSLVFFLQIVSALRAISQAFMR